ncbi:MAG: TonB-dependent receptor [Verrucomicrobia bacterium]|nr:TonB-dependent receptor [Verrucomicrobiota bacterium]
MKGWIGVVALTGIAAGACGAEAPGTTSAKPGEIVVTATRIETDPLTTPYTVHGLGGLELNAIRAVRTTPDALQSVPSAMIQKTSHGQGSPFLRGFTGFRTLMLIDGIRLNNAVFRDGPNQYWNTVDPLSLRTLEVVMGPSSVLYGSDAIGGTVNALPIQPPPAGGPEWTGRTLYRYSSAEDSHVGRVQAGGRPDERTGFVVGLSMKDFGDVTGGKDVGEQSHTGYDEWDLDAMVTRQLGDRGTLTLGHQTVRQNDAWRSHRTVYGIEWEGLKHGTDRVLSYDQARDLTWATLAAKDVCAFVDSARVTVYRQLQAEDEYRVKEDASAGEKGFEVVTWGASMQFESGTDLGRWVYGVEVSRDLVDSYSHKLTADGSVGKADIQGPVADDATYDTVGVFIQDAIPLVDGRLQILPGVRYTYNRADADHVADPVSGDATTVEGDWDAVVGSLRSSLVLDSKERVAVFGGVSQGFRAPNLSDLTRLDIARGTEIETPVTDLDPERFVSLEAGVKFRTDRVRAQVAYYRTLIDDLIVRTPTGRTIDELQEVTKRNSGQGWVEGVELAGEYRFVEDWSLRAMAAWMDGEVDAYPTSDPDPVRGNMSRLMPPTAEVAVRWQPGASRWWAEVAVRGAGEADKLSAEDARDTQRIPPGGTPGYVVGAVRGGVRVWNDTHLTAAVENLTDEDYRIHGSGVNEPGRNFVLSVDSRF